ncbi:unnamed protein product [Cuscuta epithymum]|uniref:Uncharacterized protein n=1 Tax=Cuscuta epithymum TaxID=186058 RepID=A0AAV0D5N0_9ASTE|nr:unnamed protein product [Cuscuta epithymum]
MVRWCPSQRPFLRERRKFWVSPRSVGARDHSDWSSCQEQNWSSRTDFEPRRTDWSSHLDKSLYLRQRDSSDYHGRSQAKLRCPTVESGIISTRV